jgi:hypothetical protein
MKLRLVTIIIILLCFACKENTAEWHTLEFASFQLQVPPHWRAYEEQGIDAYVAGITNGKDSFSIYFGSYVSGFQGENEQYLFAQDTINGKIAAIQVPQKDSVGSLTMFVNNAERDRKFVLSGYGTYNDLIMKIFKSLVFADSDSTRNGVLNFDKFKAYPKGAGLIIYQSTCSPCHSKTRDLTGPALDTTVLGVRTNEWFYTFFRSRHLLKNDSAYLARKKAFLNMQCIELPDYSKEDIDQLIGYLKEE